MNEPLPEGRDDGTVQGGIGSARSTATNRAPREGKECKGRVIVVAVAVDVVVVAILLVLLQLLLLCCGVGIEYWVLGNVGG